MQDDTIFGAVDLRIIAHRRTQCGFEQNGSRAQTRARNFITASEVGDSCLGCQRRACPKSDSYLLRTDHVSCERLDPRRLLLWPLPFHIRPRLHHAQRTCRCSEAVQISESSSLLLLLRLPWSFGILTTARQQKQPSTISGAKLRATS